MSRLFGVEFLDRLQSQWRDVDVHVIAAGVQDWADQRGVGTPRGVRNPCGLVVFRTREEAAKHGERERRARAADALERAHYADLESALYRTLVLEQLTPVQLAKLLNGLRSGGYCRLNPITPALLIAMGDSWGRR